MCQILALTNLKKAKLTNKLNEIANVLLKEEKDGFGYAVQGKAGVFGEKTIANKFRSRIGKSNFVKLDVIKVKYSAFGEPSDAIGPGIFHGRTSTNVVDLLNTHPMQIDNWNLIHNGVVQDFGPKYENKTDNDSEDVLRRLLDGIGNKNPMAPIEKFLQGYYAFAAIDPEGRLHICRDDNASLYIGWSATLETYIIGTTETLLLKTSKIIGAKLGPIEEMQDNTYMIFNGNEMVYQQKFKPAGYTHSQARHAMSSLGRSLDGRSVESSVKVYGMSPPRKVSSSFDRNELNDLELFAKAIGDQSIGNEGISEAEWSKLSPRDIEIEDFDHLIDMHTTKMRNGTEEDYYKYMAEVDQMDISYQIFLPDNTPITLYDFKKLDFINRELCTIIRPDGTLLEPVDYDTPRLPYRRVNND